jgi:hypothetical protein
MNKEKARGKLVKWLSWIKNGSDAHVHASYYSLHPMHCTIIFLAYVWLISLIGYVYAEPELKLPMLQVQVEDFTNLVLTQGKPQCI